MRIQNNITAMNTHRQLGINSTNLGKSTEKLSSGYRINRAADDAAGLSISEKMRSQIRGLSMASKNAQDGISLIQAAEGALQETHSILQRMRELSVQAANDVNEDIDRTAIQAEIDQLASEVDRIAYTTEFNKKTLLDGSLKDGSLTAKSITGSGVRAGINVKGLDAGTYTIEVSTVSKRTEATFSFDMTGAKEGELVRIQIATGFAVASGTDTLSAGDGVIEFTATGDALKDNAAAINLLKQSLGQSLTEFDVRTEGTKLIITSKNVNEKANTLSALAFTVTSVKADNTTGSFSVTGVKAISFVTGQNAEITIKGGYGTTGQSVTVYQNVTKSGFVVGNTYKATLSNVTGAGEITFTMNDTTKISSAIIKVSSGSSLTLQVGANTSIDQTIGIAIDNLSAAKLGVDNLSVHSNESGRAAVYALDQAIQQVSNQRSALGAVQNRLEHTVANLDTVSENLSAAESRIRDTDMAKEMMNFTKNNILIQASTAMLAQANQQPQTVLQLLQ